MKFKALTEDLAIYVDGVSVELDTGEWASLGIDEHIMAVEYDGERGIGHIEWVDNWRTGKTPPNTKFSKSDFSAYFSHEDMEKCMDLYNTKSAK